MKHTTLQILLTVAGVLAPIAVALEAWTLNYVVSIERRLARLEARDELRGAPRVRILMPPALPPAADPVRATST